MANNFIEQRRKKQGRNPAKSPPSKPIEEMSPEELRWVALEKPVEEMTLSEIQWATSPEAQRILSAQEANKPRIHNFNELKRNRRRSWK